MRLTLLTLLLLLSLNGCSPEPEKKEEPQPAPPVAAPQTEGCSGCHQMSLDQNHSFACTVCHNGIETTREKDIAHTGLIKRPAHPDNMASSCGKCHQRLVESTAHSLHFTLKNKINMVRASFGAEDELVSLTDIPVFDSPSTVLGLADDLLRRRCLRCHPYYSGDRYPAIVRGTGCASCHLEFYQGKLVSHVFMKTPGDSQCLQCHYGNRVGFDYYGRYEHDMNDEYRTPYTTRYDYFRPYGMEFHQLAADIHQQRGLVCVDCHKGGELMTDTQKKISCADCHDRSLLSHLPLATISRDDSGNYLLSSAGDGTLHPIPLMKDPAHAKYPEAACQVCHGQWAFNDQGTNLLRNDFDDYDDFSKLSVQGSFEVEKIIINNLDFDADELPHEMTDKISGESKAGLWYKGFVTRRWEEIVIGRDDSGRLQVMRPLLNIRLSWVDEDEEVQFDAVQTGAPNNGMTPYTPHTTGKAGLFYQQRIEQFLHSETLQ